MDSNNEKEVRPLEVGREVMRCKLRLNAMSIARSNDPALSRKNVHFGGVWEGSTEKQQASENAIFGAMTPNAEFNAVICNPHVLENLVPGRSYIVTFTEANN